ncbi:MAG: tagatose 1,6-diphosphate aldolase [Aeoliella sp.]
MPVTIGKWRRLQQTASERGAFSILAIDHRGPLLRALQQEISEDVTNETLTALKQDVVGALGSIASAVLLDPETSAGQCVASTALSGHTGLITALDTGSTGDPNVRRAGLIEGWTVEKAVRMGAAGIKLLIYYHPESAEANQSEELVRTVGKACALHEIPFFLEPLSCSADEQRTALPSAERREVVAETARRLAPLGVDILKAEFPVDVSEEPNEREWRAACAQLTAACPIPWVLLSAGVSFDTFLRQTRVACDAGASGVMVGRAVWKEAVTLDEATRNHFLSHEGRDRMEQLRSLCDAIAKPFTDLLGPPKTEPEWYKEYCGTDPNVPTVLS